MTHWLDTLGEEVGLLSNAELVCSLKSLVTADRVLTAKLLVHLGEVEARKLYVELGYSSMFEYCRSALGMSEAEAYLRMLAAKVGRRFPLVLERLGAGAVHLSALKLLAPLLTADNHVLLLDRAKGKTKRQVEVLVAELAPKPDVPASMRKLPCARGPVQSAAATPLSACTADTSSIAAATTALHAASVLQACGTALMSTVAGPVISAPRSASTFNSDSAGGLALASHVAPAAPGETAQLFAESGAKFVKGIDPKRRDQGDGVVHRADLTAPSASPSFALESPRARASCSPLGPGRFKLELTLDQEGHDKLEQLVELFRHQNPSGDLARLVKRALSELLERKMKQRFGHTHAPERRVAREQASAKPARVTGEAGVKNDDSKVLQPTASPTPKKAQSSGDSSGTRTSAADSGDAVNLNLNTNANAKSNTNTKSNANAKSSANVSPKYNAHAKNSATANAMYNATANARSKSDTNAKRKGNSGGSRYNPRKVLREVYARDVGQCTYVSPDGRRCTARGFLQVHHHETTYARGGEATVENLRIMCRVHNFFLAERDYGRKFMQDRLREAAAKKNAARAVVPERDPA